MADVTIRKESRPARTPLAVSELRSIDAYWRASNYLSVAQIYLYDNPLLKQPLTKDHVTPRLLGHWGTTPGLNFVYVHLNRVIKKYDLDAIYVAGPGHGGPGLVANTYLEGTYSEVYPNVSQDEEGMKRLFTQFSFPGGVPSHVDHEPETRAALDLIFSDHFSPNEPGVFAPLRDTLLARGDHYMHLADLTSYLEADRRLCALYGDGDAWARQAILNVASSGRFSSDRTIAEYAAHIWKATPCRVD